MSWTVAVGVLFAGLAGTGPAAADDDSGGKVETGADGTARGRADGAVAAGDPGPHRTERTSRDPRAVVPGPWQRPDVVDGTTAGDTDPDHPGWDCPWPDWNPVITPSVGVAGIAGVGGGGGGIIMAAPAGIAAPLIASPPVSGPATGRMLTGLTPADPEAAVPAAPPARTPPAAPPPPLPPAPAVPAAPAAAPVAIPAVAPPANAVPKSAALQSNPTRLGYPAYLQSASVADITALAILGSAGLVALAGAGGVVGYRQAKTGFALRSAGTARFLS